MSAHTNNGAFAIKVLAAGAYPREAVDLVF